MIPPLYNRKKKKKAPVKKGPRDYMLMAIEAMKNSVAEKRKDNKVSPKVGAVLVKPNGEVQSASRGELRDGDHAEFTLLERKNRAENLKGSLLFATLEPCAPGARRHPKLGCAERIVNARIKEVWVGIADPDPDVDRKGIEYLKSNGIVVHMFDRDLQQIINDFNKDFLKQAKERADGVAPKKKEIILTPIENAVNIPGSEWYSREAIDAYLNRSSRKIKPYSSEFWEHFETIGIVRKAIRNKKDVYLPTGYGVLLFGKSPRDVFPQAVVKAKVTYGNGKPSQQDFDLPLVLLPEAIELWLRKVLHSKTTRDSFQRKTDSEFPIEPLREAIVNAIVHRDYDDKGAKIYVEVDDDKIVIKSPGLPVDPITLKDVQLFRAPSLSRNPKIAYVFNRMGLMEEAELGMETFRTMEQHFHLPSPMIDFKPPYLTVAFAKNIGSVRRVSGIKVLTKLSDEELKGYEFVKSLGEITKKAYAVHFKMNDKKAQRHLSLFDNLKLVKKIGKGPSTKYVIK